MHPPGGARGRLPGDEDERADAAMQDHAFMGGPTLRSDEDSKAAPRG